ncbi:Glycosyltransferase involved in cell wall bisynthesis [Cnuella takakiae]|uniref:Glycosyltransferase involved in cell wall bisynthesis n=1 Tax=Cnuella takakiae TaxID=1302690 RepID=A0A1M5DSB7_9BACT|nr:glycosyltransferase [Cnuella takakiae]OLY93886.1 hypothetical protein BUE76_19880 [Cnuella takakiae]SHF69826.1 Glycosyltransferase involved in cell wall bisynthesis [Cnuella takakiae]
MPRILRIFNRMIVGGPVLNATYLTYYLAPEFETLMVSGPREPQEADASFLAEKFGIQLRIIPEMGRTIDPWSDLQALRRLRQIIREFRPDIVHTHAAKPGALGRLAAAAMGVPVVVHTYHGHVFHSYFNTWKTKLAIGVERWLARKTDAIIAISEQQQKELVDVFRIAPPAKFRQIKLGIDLDKFGQDQLVKRSLFRNQYGVQEEELAIGIIGRLVPVKNHVLFLDGIQYLLQHSHRKIKAFIVGDGESCAAIQLAAKERGIRFSRAADNAHPYPLVFTSWRRDVDVVMAGLDIVTLTSFNEGTPVSLIEAQAAGKPIVSTRVGGIADIVQEGVTALLADVADGGAFCRQLTTLVTDDALRKKMGMQSRELVIERFGYQRLISETADLYRQLLNQKAPHVSVSKEKYTHPRLELVEP